MSRQGSRALSVYAGLIACSAYGGAIGLAGGGADPKGTLDARLPFASPVFAACALALIVGVPNTVLARFAWRNDGRAPVAAIAAGVLLVGWIVVELAVIREWSWLQPVYAAIGASLVVIGRSRLLPDASSAREHERAGGEHRQTERAERNER